MQQLRVTARRRTMIDNWKENASSAYLFSLKVLGRFDVVRDKAAARADTEYRQRGIDMRAFSQNITTSSSSSSFKDQACILLPRDDRFNTPSLSLSLFLLRASLASKLLLTIKADPDIKGYRAPSTRSRYIVIQRSNRIRGISCRRDGESLPSSLKSVCSTRTFRRLRSPCNGEGYAKVF